MANLTDIKTGRIVKVQGDPYLVTWNQFMRKQACKPVMRTKLKNLINGSVLDKTFLASPAAFCPDNSIPPKVGPILGIP